MKERPREPLTGRTRVIKGGWSYPGVCARAEFFPGLMDCFNSERGFCRICGECRTVAQVAELFLGGTS